MRAAWLVVLAVAAGCSGPESGGEPMSPAQPLASAPVVPWFGVPSPVGREERLIDGIEARLAACAGTPLAFERDVFGSLIVRADAPAGPTRLLVAVAADEACYAISQIRDDGLLRLRTLARGADPAFHIAREGRPVVVLTRAGQRPGVIMVNSVHLRATRAEAFGEEHLWLDVGADSPADVAALGIELLDPVVQHETVELAGGVAEPSAGARAALRALVETLGRARSSGTLPADVAVAFVAQSQVGTGPLGRGGEAVVRRLQPQTTIVLRGAEIAEATSGPSELRGNETAWQALELRVAHAGTPVELVADADVAVLEERLQALLPWRTQAQWQAQIGPAPAARPGGPPPFSRLRNLVMPHGVSGHEGRVRDEVRRQLAEINPSWQVVEDEAGNLVLSLGEGDTMLAFVAHMDEIGLEVTAVRDDGRLETKRLGGMLEHLYRDTALELLTRGGQIVPCIAQPKPKDAPKGSDPAIVIDIGARSAADVAKLGVAVGDVATVPKELEMLGAHRAAGRANDDRVGCTALLLALQELGPDAYDRLRDAGRRVVFAWSTREEVGLEGADALARALRPVPDVVFAIDTFVTSDSPMEDPRYAFAKLGAGPVLRALDNTSLTPRATLDRVREIAAGADGGEIPLQIGVMGGGNDGSRFVPEGAIDCPLAWPQRCSHSRVETLDLRDLRALGRLVAAVALDF